MSPKAEKIWPLLFRPDATVSKVAKREYAGQLLDQEQAIPRRPVSIDRIQFALQDTVQAELDMELVFELGFAEMDWQLVDLPRSLYGLFLGKKNNDNNEAIRLSDAEGIIAVNTHLTPEGAIEFTAVDVAGVAPDTAGNNRVVSLRYDATTHNLDHMAVSFGRARIEESYLTHPYHVRLIQLPTQPSLIDHWRFTPHTTKVITTDAMAAKTEGHTQALEIDFTTRRFSRGDLGTAGMTEHEVTGFYEAATTTHQVIGVRNLPIDSRSDLQTVWEIAVPRQLTKKLR
jgi:hypothetical protein